MTTRILIGDVRDQLKTLPANYFDCVVTSPPYWGLRDYGVDGQIGLEPTLGEHLAVMADVFREVRRVLKHQGTLWLNYGDCYAAEPNGKSAAEYKADGSDDRTFRDKPFSTVGPVHPPAAGNPFPPNIGRRGGGNAPCSGYLKPKDLCMMANRLAIALQDDGWWVRSEIIWHKPNPMPESVYDRPTSAHEKVWLLTKSDEYFYNHEAIREPVTESTKQRLAQNVDAQSGSARVYGGTTPQRPMKAVRRKLPPKDEGRDDQGLRVAARLGGGAGWRDDPNSRSDTRNARNVWTIAPRAFREAHFATFPPELAERCIRAGVPLSTCAVCGEAKAAADCGGLCPTLPRGPGRVLDPFGGAGTVGLVAQQLGLDCTLIELNPDYAEIARRRLGLDEMREAAE